MRKLQRSTQPCRFSTVRATSRSDSARYRLLLTSEIASVGYMIFSTVNY